jgi:carbamoylphosphate synthase small subunit
VLLSLQGKHPPAILALADGTVFVGTSIGHSGTCVGAMVFNTSMTGYQEILTDPSYCQQIVTLTYPILVTMEPILKMMSRPKFILLDLSSKVCP